MPLTFHKLFLMGYNNSKITHDGYGKSYRTAAMNLGYKLQYHYGNFTVHQAADNQSYYAFNGKKYQIYFTNANGCVRAFIYV